MLATRLQGCPQCSRISTGQLMKMTGCTGVHPYKLPVSHLGGHQ